jgi:catechol 2,3-dioxygenase-like lactoylglutathione lyase family enzyme
VEPIIDHIEITVRDMAAATRFYDQLLPLLGFDLQARTSAAIEPHEKHVVSYEHRAVIVSAPREYPEYTPPGYYALFFKDPDGIKYEIVCTAPEGA